MALDHAFSGPEITEVQTLVELRVFFLQTANECVKVIHVSSLAQIKENIYFPKVWILITKFTRKKYIFENMKIYLTFQIFPRNRSLYKTSE